MSKTTVSFSIPGEPKGKQRPRVTVRGQFAHAYTPKETVSYENLVKMAYYNKHEKIALQGGLKVEIIFFFSIPKSTSKKRALQMLNNEIKYTKKPDVDNITKIIMDALNGVAFHDDSQVCDLSVKKRYAEIPRAEITLTELD